MICICSPSPAARAARRRSDTLDEVLAAPDREVLLEWLVSADRWRTAQGTDLMVHAGRGAAVDGGAHR